VKIDRNPFHSLVLKSMFEDKDTGAMLNEMSEMVTKNITFNEADFPYWAVVFDSLLNTIKSQMDEDMLGVYEVIRKGTTVVAIKKEGKK
jgi:hypothetical protein